MVRTGDVPGVSLSSEPPPCLRRRGCGVLSPLPAVSREGCARFRGRAHRPPHPLVGNCAGLTSDPFPGPWAMPTGFVRRQCAGTVPPTYRGLDNRRPRRPMCGDGAPHLPGVGQSQTATTNVRGRCPAPTWGWTTTNRDGRCAGTVPRTYRGLDSRKPRRPMCGDGAPHLPGVGQSQTVAATVRGRRPAPTGGWAIANRDGRCAGTVPRACRGLDNRKPRRPMCGDGAPHLPGGWTTANRDGQCAGTVPRTYRGLDNRKPRPTHPKKIKQ